MVFAMSPQTFGSDEELMSPQEVAAVFGVRVPTVARWAREGTLKPAALTPGGHRRYSRRDVAALLESYGPGEPAPEHVQMLQDAVRLYDQGWSIRRVAEEFGFSYGKMRRALSALTPLRNRRVRP